MMFLTEFHGSDATRLTAAADAVFAALVDVDRLPEWNARIHHVIESPAPASPVAEGTEWVVQMRASGGRWPSRSRALVVDPVAHRFQATILEPAPRGHEVVATARRPETLGGPTRCPAARSGGSPSSRPSMPRSPPGHSNASETARGTVEATPLSEYERLLGLNFLGALRVTKAVLSGFRERGRPDRIEFPDVRPGRPPLGTTDKTCYRTDIVVLFPLTFPCSSTR